MKNLNLSKQEIINRIGYFRNKNNISAYKLGEILGHSKSYMYRVESGEIQLSLDKLLSILEVLETTTSEFFCPFIDKEDLELFDSINSLSADSKKTIMELIKKLK